MSFLCRTPTLSELPHWNIFRCTVFVQRAEICGISNESTREDTAVSGAYAPVSLQKFT